MLAHQCLTCPSHHLARACSHNVHCFQHPIRQTHSPHIRPQTPTRVVERSIQLADPPRRLNSVLAGASPMVGCTSQLKTTGGKTAHKSSPLARPSQSYCPKRQNPLGTVTAQGEILEKYRLAGKTRDWRSPGHSWGDRPPKRRLFLRWSPACVAGGGRLLPRLRRLAPESPQQQSRQLPRGRVSCSTPAMAGAG
jgi:hypothetical protein